MSGLEVSGPVAKIVMAFLGISVTSCLEIVIKGWFSNLFVIISESLTRSTAKEAPAGTAIASATERTNPPNS